MDCAVSTVTRFNDDDWHELVRKALRCYVAAHPDDPAVIKYRQALDYLRQQLALIDERSNGESAGN